MIDDLDEVFEKYDDEYLRDKNIITDRRLHRRPDINAFLLLDKLVPGTTEIISGAEHGEIYLDVDQDELAKVATEEDIADLLRCGVRSKGIRFYMVL